VGLAVVVVGLAVVVVGLAVVVVGLAVVVVGLAVVLVGATWQPGRPWPGSGLHVLPGLAVAGPAKIQVASAMATTATSTTPEAMYRFLMSLYYPRDWGRSTRPPASSP